MNEIGDGSTSSVGDWLTVPITNNQIVNDSARDSDPEVNIANDVIVNQYVKEDEFIEEEKQKRRRPEQRRFTETLSDAKITSGSSYNQNRDQDQDQEKGEELGISRKFDWDARENYDSRTQEEPRNLKSVNVSVHSPKPRNGGPLNHLLPDNKQVGTKVNNKVEDIINNYVIKKTQTLRDDNSGVEEPVNQIVEPRIFLESDSGNGKASALVQGNGHGYKRWL